VDRDDIIRMAREAGAKNYGTGEEGATALMLRDDAIERFAALVAAHEREECAKVANAWQTDVLNPLYQCDCATAIRRRGEK
jgi:Mn-dependent DtxR family transcriptional regulator